MVSNVVEGADSPLRIPRGCNDSAPDYCVSLSKSLTYVNFRQRGQTQRDFCQGHSLAVWPCVVFSPVCVGAGTGKRESGAGRRIDSGVFLSPLVMDCPTYNHCTSQAGFWKCSRIML